MALAAGDWRAEQCGAGSANGADRAESARGAGNVSRFRGDRSGRSRGAICSVSSEVSRPGSRDRESGSGVGTGSRDREPGPGAGTGSRDREPGPGVGTGSRDREPGPGAGAGSRDREPGPGAGTRDRESGSGAGTGSRDREPGSGVGIGSRDREPPLGPVRRGPIMTSGRSGSAGRQVWKT